MKIFVITRDTDMADIFQSYQNFIELKISKKGYGRCHLINKVFKIIIFILYTWLIINSYFYLYFPIIIYEGSYELLYNLFLAKYFAIYGAIFKFKYVLLNPYLPLYTYITLNFFIGIYPLILWCKEQTVFRAWILAELGFIFYPGFFLLLDLQIIYFILGVLGISLFYFLIDVINDYQRKFYPNNKLINTLRAILV